MFRKNVWILLLLCVLVVMEGVEVTEPSPTDSNLPALPVSAAVPENIPEHLKFPAALKHAYHSTRALSPEEKHRLQDIFTAIVSDYNPGRSRAAVWPAFIAAEKAYRAHAAEALGEPLIGTLGGSRYEWQYEQAWAFPEIMECFVAESDPETISLFVRAHQIAMGDLSVDHNEVHLLDGRRFRMRSNHQYVFRYDAEAGVGMTHRDETVYTPGAVRPDKIPTTTVLQPIVKVRSDPPINPWNIETSKPNLNLAP